MLALGVIQQQPVALATGLQLPVVAATLLVTSGKIDSGGAKVPPRDRILGEVTPQQ